MLNNVNHDTNNTDVDISDAKPSECNANFNHSNNNKNLL